MLTNTRIYVSRATDVTNVIYRAKGGEALKATFIIENYKIEITSDAYKLGNASNPDNLPAEAKLPIAAFFSEDDAVLCAALQNMANAIAQK